MVYKRILIVNIFGIGDVLFTTPMIANLRRHLPEVKIGFLGNRRTAPILEDNPDIDRVHIYERDEFHAAFKRCWLEFAEMGKRLFREIKQENYDLVIDLSLNTNIGFVLKAIGIPLRIGYNYKNRGIFLTQKLPFNGYENKHVAEYYLDILSCLGLPCEPEPLQLTVKQEDHIWAERFLQEKPAHGKTLVGLVPGGGASWGRDAAYKRWGAYRYAELADKLVEKFHCQIILFGDEKEIPLCEELAARVNFEPIMACGKTSVSQMAALMNQCAFVVCNDGGPLHIAAASGVRTVSIFGPVDAKVYGPFPSQGHRVVEKGIACRPCYRQFRRAQCDHINCLARLEPDDVMAEISELLVSQQERSK